MPLLKRLLAVLLATMPCAAGSLAADYDCPRTTLIVPYPAARRMWRLVCWRIASKLISEKEFRDRKPAGRHRQYRDGRGRECKT